ncbi:phosphatidylinositol transfer protein beta isoform-like isoform X2 [Daphnia pulex]|uniref:phosphatidylinositol transfer protein beta isoform-like isoform X2 n=1 Tax=Daphnia pulex TaxID=6669 RepID=UPI001EDD691C|nr:phosphatidylinositol transfer protein beta isoform-like isoform X2 [Daphnia pulex]XP_046634575.1 phosphatidylinositol transfer protein beta isoform-like isoform X2 [Daphnia pulicaria]
MLIKEFRIPMPLSVEEYQYGQLYAFSVESLNNTGGGEGIEVLRSEPFKDVLLNNKRHSGQYTYKIYHMGSKAPGFMKHLMPKGSFEFHEESWNAYPYSKTVISNPKFMKENFQLVIESIHHAGGPDVDNILDLSEEMLKLREVVHVDIANDKISSKDYKADLDPTIFRSKKTGRGPLTGSWLKSGRVENHIMNTEQRIFNLFHRQIFCLLDEWCNMSMEDIRKFEDKVKEELDKQLKYGEPRGMTAE